MSIREVFGAKSSDEINVCNHFVDFFVKLIEDLVLLTLLQLHLQIDVRVLVALNFLDNGFRVLLLKGIQVPLLLLVGENVAVVPQSVALKESFFKDFDFFELYVLNLKHFLILLVVLHFVGVDFVLLADFCKFGQGLNAQHIGLRQHLVVECVDLLADESLLLFNL